MILRGIAGDILGESPGFPTVDTFLDVAGYNELLGLLYNTATQSLC